MTTDLADDRVRHLRARAQWLTPARPDEQRAVAAMVGAVGGLQAQEPAAAALGARARLAGPVAADVEHARVVERSIARTWAMRGTLHLVATADLGWLLPLLGPVFIAASRRRYAQLGLTEDLCRAGVRAIRDHLAEREPLTRADLAAHLARQGIPTAGQAIFHLIRRAALEGALCLGPDREGEPTHVPLDTWVAPPPTPTRADALALLARRYLAAHGPAAPDDLAAWSGLPRRDARAGWQRIAADLLAVTAAGRPAWLLASRAAWLTEAAAPDPIVRLIPAYDSYLLGHHGRDLTVPPAHARAVHPGGGVLHPTLLIDGLAAGTWRTARRAGRLEVIVAPFAPLPPASLPALEAEAADVGRFLGLTGTLSVRPTGA